VTPEEVELLSQLTIVIPTCEKPENLERSIEYWRDIPVTVHIVDGSATSWFSGEQLKDLPRVIYHHFPRIGNEELWGNFCRRMREASLLPVTRYSALCADDDAFTVSGMLAILTTLENDQTVDAMIGRNASYDRTESVPTWRLIFSSIRNSSEFRSEDVSVRLHNSHFAPWLYYGIVRTDLWRQLLQISFRYTIRRTEQLMSIVDKALCRIQLIERIVWLRQGYVLRTNVPEFLHKESSAIQRLLELNRFVERRIMCRQIVIAILHSSPDFGRLKAKRKARIMTRYLILNGVFSDNRRKQRITRRIIGLLSFISPDFRRRITKSLPERISGSLGYFERAPKVAMATKRTDLISFIANVENSGIKIVPDEIEAFQRLLLKPREQLRLRANI